ncbi:P-loop containing nucleoside triphosphate hydrolase protein [Durotheca rogersii]|uniref:P-loop containing nucleoside triphosphate hydrolase protein n=1 Tax=Durotheca rogersii TaxID=419775 RepID=UPI00221E7EC6|nr:P-loop containing nucleoside triphosphate hydrolase protein [Durotheca rogersii]KAI5867132.1 P-loop containing nucleoside triphosphate hydrolase protein [Durotheca rogersii]
MPSAALGRAMMGSLPPRGAGIAKLACHLAALPPYESSSLLGRPMVLRVSPQSHLHTTTTPLATIRPSSRVLRSPTPPPSSPPTPLCFTSTSRLPVSPSPWRPPTGILTRSYASQPASQVRQNVAVLSGREKNSATATPEVVNPANTDLQAHEGFGKSEKASKAAHVNLRARLSHDGKDSKKPQASLGEIWRLVKIAKPEAKPLALAVVLLLISSSLFVSLPLVVGKVMNLATSKTIEETEVFGLSLYQFFAAFGVALTVGACANFGRIVLLRIIGERVVTRLRSQLFRKTYSQDAEFFDANRVGDLISRLSTDTIVVGKSITQNVSDGMRSIVNSVSGLALMAWLSPSLTAVILVAAPFIGTASFVYSRIIRKLSRKMQQNLGTLTKIAEERLGNVKTSQAFVGEGQEVRRYNKQVRKVFELGKKQSIYDASYFSGTSWMGNMTIIALLWFGGNLVRDGIMTAGDLTTFVMYAFWAGGGLFGVASFYSELMKGVGAATRIFELQDRNMGISSTKGVKVTSAQGPITFSNVTFAYPTRPAVTIFNGLNFEIPSGTNVCIVGPSGGGKSTVSSLLLRFYDVTSGSISINGVDISKMNAKSLRRRIGMVSQEPVLFSGTVAENIAYGKPDATRAEVVTAAQKANCGFISDFPQGLETQVGPRGTQLSGGQKQRIAIARALIKDPDILILDEATSALDAESETAVNLALTALLKGRRRTTISIAHRLSTIKRSDSLIVLSSNGTVAEVGSFEELSANPKSEFSRLMEWQMSGGEVPTAARRGPQLSESEIIEEELEEGEEDEEEDEEDGPREETRQKSEK